MNRKFSVFASAAFVVAVTVAITVLLALPSAAPARAQEDDAPVITFANPAEGAVINEPAYFVQLCFEKPVNIKDLDKGGDFAFSLTPPEDFPLGLRIVFQPDGQGLAIYPNNNDADTPEGEWTLDYRLTSPGEDLVPLEGTLTWTVDPDGEATPQSTPPACLDSGFTATPGPGGATAPPVLTTGTPTDSTPSVTEADGGNGDDSSEPDILVLALLTIGAAGGIGLIALIAFFVRRGVGYEPHRPGPDDEPPQQH